jgi:hypothetical protein
MFGCGRSSRKPKRIRRWPSCKRAFTYPKPAQPSGTPGEFIDPRCLVSKGSFPLCPTGRDVFCRRAAWRQIGRVRKAGSAASSGYKRHVTVF